MKPLFGGLVIILMFFLIEIETAGNLNKIKTKYTDTTAERDDQARRDDHRITQILGTPARPIKRRAPRKNPRAVRGHRAGFELECEIDETGEKAQKRFLSHYQERGLPNAPDTTLTLYNERHSSGSYQLPEEQRGTKGHSYEEARKVAFGPFVQQHHQQMYQQHQALQDHSGGSGSISKGLAGGSGLGSGNNPYTSLPMTPAEDLYAQFDIQPPEHLDFEQNLSQNNLSAASLIDNYNINLRRKYGDHSKGSGSD